MAQLFWQASDHELGSQASEIFGEHPDIENLGIRDVDGRRVLHLRSINTEVSTKAVKFLLADNIADKSDISLVLRARTGGTNARYTIWLRADEEDYMQRAYRFGGVLPSAFGGNQLHWVSGGALSVIASDNSKSLQGVWHSTEFNVQGSDIRARAYMDGDSDPGWLMNTTHNGHSGSGAVWVGVQTQHLYIESIGVGTDGDPAPMEPVGEPIHLEALSTTATAADARLTRRARLGAASEAVSAARGAPVRRIEAAATAAASTAATGSLARPVHLSAQSVTTTGASLQAAASIRLAATATVTTSTAAGLRRWVQPVGITEATSSTSGALARRVRMRSRADTYTGAGADVLRVIRMVGSARAASAAYATLSVGDPLPHPTTLGVTIEDIYTLGVTIEDIYTLAAIIED